MIIDFFNFNRSILWISIFVIFIHGDQRLNFPIHIRMYSYCFKICAVSYPPLFKFNFF